MFLDLADSQVQKIRDALEQEEHESVAISAHTYKGTVAALEADTASRLASRLESMGRDKNLDGGQSVLEELERRNQQLKEAIDSYLESGRC